MRQKKCKECNPVGSAWNPEKGIHTCTTCQGTGEISVFTIQELREGKVWCVNDGTEEEIRKVIKNTFPADGVPNGTSKFYGLLNNGKWNDVDEVKEHETQSVKIFLEEIEQEENMKRYCAETFYCRTASVHMDGKCAECGLTRKPVVEQPEFKWGEEVEAEGYHWVKGIYCCLDPLATGRHLVNVGGEYNSYSRVRKPQKITITLSQIAEAFKCKPEQIVIPELKKS